LPGIAPAAADRFVFGFASRAGAEPVILRAGRGGGDGAELAAAGADGKCEIGTHRGATAAHAAMKINVEPMQYPVNLRPSH